MPTFVPNTSGPKPDVVSGGPLYEDGYSTYPANPVKANGETPPGTGSKVDIFTTAFLPLPPNALDQNPAWQEVNKQLNATVNFNTVSQADFQAKFAALLAGQDLPDIILVRDATPNISQILQTQAADLTPFLGGDAIKDYPNLAAIPTFSWKNNGGVQNGRLYMIPIHRYAPGYTLYRNSEVYDAEIGPTYTPKNADDFKRVLQQLNKPQQGRWAIGAWQNTQFQLTYFASTFGAPNNWGLDASSGKLAKDFETPQFKEAVDYVRDLVASGLYHPDSLTLVDVNAGRANFLAGKWILNLEIFGVAWQDLLQRGPKTESTSDGAAGLALCRARRREGGALLAAGLYRQQHAQESTARPYQRAAADHELDRRAVRQCGRPPAHCWREGRGLHTRRRGQRATDGAQ